MNRHKISENKYHINRYLVFFVFLILTLISWLMNKLARDYDTVIQLVPEINSVTGTYSDVVDNTLFVQVSASGFFILRKKFVTKNVFYINSENIPKTKQSVLKIPTATLKDNIRESFDKKIKIISIDPDTIYFNASERISKKVPVVANFNLSFKDEFRQSAAVRFVPDSVTITGAKNDIDDIKSFVVPFKKYDNLDQTVEDISTPTTNPYVFVSPSKIRYTIPIERCTEGTVSVPIKIANLPQTTNLILLPANVNIKYTVPVKNYKSISSGDFSVEVDYNETAETLNRQIMVKIVRKPDFAFNLNVEPAYVEFLIQK